MDRKTVKNLLPDYVAGKLAPGERDAVGAMVAADPRLAKECAELKQYFAILAGLPGEKAPKGFSGEVMRRIRNAADRPPLVERLFKPLHIKLPIEAAALLVTAVLVVIIYYPRMQPQPAYQTAERSATEEKTSSKASGPIEEAKPESAPERSTPPAAGAVAKSARRSEMKAADREEPKQALALAEESFEKKKLAVQPSGRSFAPEAPERASPSGTESAKEAQAASAPTATALAADYAASQATSAPAAAPLSGYAAKTGPETANAISREAPSDTWELALSSRRESINYETLSTERSEAGTSKAYEASQPAKGEQETVASPIERIIQYAGGVVVRMETNKPAGRGTRYTITIPADSCATLAASLARHGRLSAPLIRPSNPHGRVTIVLILR